MATEAGGEDFVKQADNLLTKELSRLSVQDRNDINEEIHGVRTLAPAETPELLERSLVKLNTCLRQLITNPPSLKDAFNLSQRPVLNQITQRYETVNTYVNDANFRLRFLRCELFDEKKAALRMIKYLDLAFELCGDYALRRPIQLTDFSKAEMKVLRSGCMQLLPYRDRAGRPIVSVVGDLGLQYSTRLKVKVLLYTLYVAGDIESQRKGLVALTCPYDHLAFPDFSVDSDDKQLFERFIGCTSIRLCAMHLFVPDTFRFRMLRLAVVGMISPSVRPRLKFYVETGIARKYIFKGYGIPTENIPITDTGNVKLGFLRQWIKLRTLLKDDGCEGKNILRKSDIVEFPRSSDVLYRTGTTTSCHPGNAAFRDLIESKFEEVQFSSNFSFSELAEELIEEILANRTGRFLKWDNNGYWVVLKDRAQTNAKVTASIRDFNRWKIARRNIQTLESSTSIFEQQEGQKRRKTHSDDCY